MDDREHETRVMLVRLEERIVHMQETVERLGTELDEFVRLARYLPVERAVFALIGLICTSVIGFLLVKVFAT